MNLAVLSSSAYQDEVANYRSGTGSASSVTLPVHRVRVNNPNSQWIQELESRFNELVSLPRGWDGYDGRPVSFSCAQFAANIIDRLCIENVPAPQMVPGADGTLQLEWHVNGFDVEVDVLGVYSVIASRFNQVTGLDEEIEIQTDFTELANWIEELGQANNRMRQLRM